MFVLAALLLIQSPALPEKHLVEQLRIASPGPDGEFVAVATVAEGEGRIYISDWRAPAVYRFDSTGRYLGQVGRSGDGPGEYRIPITIGMRGDSLWLWDPTQQRLTLWDAGGKVVRTTTLVGASGSYGAGVLLPDGSVASLPSWTSARARSGTSSEPVRRFHPDGRFRDTLFTLPVDVAPLKIETGPQHFIIGEQPFIDSPILSVSTAGLGFVRVDRRTTGPAVIGITRYDANGAERWRRSIPHSGAPLDPSLVDSVIRGYTHPSDPRSTAVPESQAREAVTIPPRGIPVLSATIGSDGRIWLRRPTSAGRPARYTVLAPDGTPSFEVTLPLRGRLIAAEATAIWVMESDTDDLPTVVRYRLQ